MLTGTEYTTAMQAYMQRKAGLKALWEKTAGLKGDAYTAALKKYRAEKAAVKGLYTAIQTGESKPQA